MARNEIRIATGPEEVFAILTNAHAFAEWVVGAKEVRCVDVAWPRPGTAFHHTFTLGLVHISDTTTIVEIDPPRRLVLEARTRPLARGRIVLTLTETGEGTTLTMSEEITSGPLKIPVRMLDALVRLRNARSLRTLKRLAERQVMPPRPAEPVARTAFSAGPAQERRDFRGDGVQRRDVHAGTAENERPLDQR